MIFANSVKREKNIHFILLLIIGKLLIFYSMKFFFEIIKSHGHYTRIPANNNNVVRVLYGL